LALQNSFLLAEEGSIDAELRDGLTAVVLGVKDLPGMGRYWQQRRSYFHPDFSSYVDELLATEFDEPVDIYSEYRIPRTEPE